MANATKVTKVQMLALIKAEVSAHPEMVAFCDHEIELLNKKNASKGETAAQKASLALKPIILEVLRSIGGTGTVTQLAMADERLSLTEGITSQKITSVLGMLCEEGKVKRAEGKKAIFSIV